ncbi:zonular occludens toxin domain-containing protein [Actinomycetes bacterium KLBMP 9759]
MTDLEPGDDSPVIDAELLSDVQSRYVTDWLELAKKQGFREPSTAIVVRPRGTLVRRAELARHAGAGVQWIVGRTVAGWRAAPVARARSVAAYRMRKAPIDALRLIWFVLRGNGRWIGKGWTFLTYADLRADARTARLSGDAEARRKAQELIRADSRARWDRLAMLAEIVWRAGGAFAAAGLLLWVVDATMSRADMWPWLASVYDGIEAGASVAVHAAPFALVTGLMAWLVASAYEGRDTAPGAGFLVRPDRDDADSWIDERMISQALAHLGIAPLDRFFKDGGQLVYTVPARVDGDGTYAQVRLPMGATADMVADRVARLAANLGRAKLETWPTEGTEAGLLDLWVADKGKLGKGAGAWPLLHDGTVDVFDGVPFGRSQRGLVVNAPIMERNYLVGGQPGQGKSSAGRTLCLGCALDPTVELRVYVFAANPDFDPFRPRLTHYVKSDDDDAIAAGLAELRELRDDVTRRGELLERHGASKVTRKLADTVRGLHPKVVTFDECHEMFEHPQYGEEARSLAIKVVKKARKCGITLVFLTQSPTAASIPKDLTRNCSNGVAFAVADQVANDGLLGSGKYRQGIRATELRPGDDRGTAVTVGLTSNRFELVSTFYVAFDEDRDDVTPVIARAMALLDENGRALPASDADEPVDDDGPDVLTDLRHVLGDAVRVRTQTVLQRLAELNPSAYDGWTFRQLGEALAGHGLTVRKYNGTMGVRTADVARALAERDEIDGDDDV